MRKNIKALAMLAGMIIILAAQSCEYLDKRGGSKALKDKLKKERIKVGRALLEVTGGGIDEILPYYTDDIEYHDPVVDIYGKEHMTGFLYQLIENSSPDLETIVEEETLIDDVYSATWVMKGTFNGIYYEAKGISIFKFEPYSINVYYQRDYYSEGDIMATIASPDPNIPGLDQLMYFFREQYKCSVVPDYPCSLPPPSSDSNNQMHLKSRNLNHQLDVGRLLVQLDAENWPSVIPYLADDYEYHDPIVDIYSPDTMAEFLARLFAGSTDLYTVVEDETLVDDIYMATWTMTGIVNGAVIEAPGMSIVKFKPGTEMVMYSRDYYSEGDIMIGIDQLREAILGFREYYLCAVDPKHDCQLVQ
ncbi:nuclear transport factor 2 family protein [Carboxylicivirga sp. N1Y90]|uniref:nuclear transport factor 2 family protein n=1 Tax=Carboxylicivirga fragile TaxID=3417571 RepID=UPI003D326D3D|nr:nuclear transport factor 2 family protein [Marinilabiliaceae bacterium N1Y90]